MGPRSRHLLGLALLALALLVLPPLLPHDARLPDWEHAAMPPDARHWLGTDAIGRDILQRCLAGGRVSLSVGTAAALAGTLLGVLLGALAGFRGGWLDAGLSLVMDALSALPFLLIVVLLLALLPPGLPLLVAAIAGYVWVDVARIVRPLAREIGSRPFIDAARLLGYRWPYLVGIHVLPNLRAPALHALAQVVPAAILMESFLSFLGLSPLEGGASLGSLIADGIHEMDDNPAALLAPVLLLAALLVLLQGLGDALANAETATGR